jgi:hypothetical protein
LATTKIEFKVAVVAAEPDMVVCVFPQGNREHDWLSDMDERRQEDETWAKRFSSLALDKAHVPRVQSLPVFEVPSELDARLLTLLETLTQAEARHAGR